MPEEIERNLLDRAAALWPAHRIDADLAKARAELLRASDSSQRRLSAEIECLEQDLELARVRDRLQQSRPPDCWCFGLGGHGRVAQGLDDEGEPLLAGLV